MAHFTTRRGAGFTRLLNEPPEELDPWDEGYVADKKSKAKRPPPISFRFSKEVLDFFEKDKPGWQSRIHTVLINYVTERKRVRDGSQRHSK